MSLFRELKRRNVIRVGLAYAVVSWVVLQVVDLVLEYISAPLWVMQVFMLALAIGLPIVLMIAWVFEITPEGVKREKEVDRSQSITPETGRKLDRIIIVFLVIAVVFLLADRFTFSEVPPGESPPDAEPAAPGTGPASPPKPEPERDKSIAVLPLANRSANPEDAYFAEGIHDELLTRLSRISALRVISRTSVMGYAGTNKRMPEIGEELGVSTLLEGGVQRAGDRVRINVQLIDAASDEHLWAEVYDRKLTTDNLFDIQSDITRSIADALKAVLSSEEQQTLEEKPTDDVEAYAFYLRGKAAAASYGRTVEQIDRSIASYRKAIELDPDFAAAWAALSTDYTERFWITGRTGNLDEALEALERARRLAPDSVDTAIAEGYYHYWGNLEYDRAIEAFDRALAAKPGSMLALRGKAYVQRRLGRIEEALDSFEQIVSLDPLNAEIPVDQAYALWSHGQTEAAMKRLGQARALGVRSSFLGLVEYLVLASQGRLDDAKATLGAPQPGAPDFIAVLMTDIARYTQDQDWLNALEGYARTWIRDDALRPGSRVMLGWVLRAQDKNQELHDFLNDIEPGLLQLQQESRNASEPTTALIQLYGLRGDRGRLDETVRFYDEQLKPDYMRPIEEGSVIPTAYAAAGDIEAALDRAQSVVDEFGSWSFWRYHFDPVFDPYRDHPRYRALDDAYLAWRETQSP